MRLLTVDEIKRFIEDDAISDKKRMARIGQRYYEAEHDIFRDRLYNLESRQCQNGYECNYP